MLVTVAVVAPQCERGDAEAENVQRALDHIDAAADSGAKIIAFPEGYPGPYNGPVTYSPMDALAGKAKQRRVYVIAGMVERAESFLPDEVYHLALKLIGPSGTVVGTYHRVLPNPKEMNAFLMGGKVIAPGDRLEVFETEYGRIGLLVCSEIWSPELPLILSLKGADIIFAPIGGALYELHDNWKTILRARAAENHVYVLASQNHWGMEDGLNIIAGPEEIIAESTRPGVLLGSLDLARLQWLRTHNEDLKLPKPYRTIPGLLRHRRPDLYDQITRPQADAYDFWYFLKKPVEARRTVKTKP